MNDDFTFAVSNLTDGLDSTARPRLLQADDPWDAGVLMEGSSLATWTNISPRFVHTDRRTAAGPPATIFINRMELEMLFSSLQSSVLETARCYALAHEFGHLLQFAVFGYENTRARPRIAVEAHADILAGAWLGYRMGDGYPHDSDLLHATGLTLKRQTQLYPSPESRALLMTTGMAQSLWLTQLTEPSLKDDPSYAPLNQGLKVQDVEDLYGNACRLLQERGEI